MTIGTSGPSSQNPDDQDPSRLPPPAEYKESPFGDLTLSSHSRPLQECPVGLIMAEFALASSRAGWKVNGHTLNALYEAGCECGISEQEWGKWVDSAVKLRPGMDDVAVFAALGNEIWHDQALDVVRSALSQMEVLGGAPLHSLPGWWKIPARIGVALAKQGDSTSFYRTFLPTQFRLPHIDREMCSAMSSLQRVIDSQHYDAVAEFLALRAGVSRAVSLDRHETASAATLLARIGEYATQPELLATMDFAKRLQPHQAKSWLETMARWGEVFHSASFPAVVSEHLPGNAITNHTAQVIDKWVSTMLEEVAWRDMLRKEHKSGHRFAELFERSVVTFLKNRWDMAMLVSALKRAGPIHTANVLRTIPHLEAHVEGCLDSALNLLAFPIFDDWCGQALATCVNRCPQGYPVADLISPIKDMLQDTVPSFLIWKYAEWVMNRFPAGGGDRPTADTAPFNFQDEPRHRADISRAIRVRHVVLEWAGKGTKGLSQEDIQDKYRDLTRNDTLPCRPDDPRADQMRKEIMSGFQRMLDHAYGFKTFTFDARGFRNNPLWPLASAGIALGGEVSRLHATSSDRFPGKGVYISGIDPGRVYPEDLSGAGERYALFKSLAKRLDAEQEVDLLEQTSFLFTRAFVLVHVHGEAGNLPAIRTHYSYIFYNEHFGNPDLILADLVPSGVMAKLIRPSLMALDEESAAAVPIDAVVGSATQLRDRVRSAGKILLDVSSPGNIGGSFSNAFPPGSQPFFSWEQASHTGFRDVYNHLHKPYLLGPYDPGMNVIKDSDLAPLRGAHAEVYALLSRYHKLFDLFLLSLAHYNQGKTLVDGAKFITGEELLDMSDVDSEDREESSELEDLFANGTISENTFVRLRQAYMRRADLSAARAPAVAYPVFALVPALQIQGRPNPLITLDTRTMKLRFHRNTPWDGEEIELPKDSDGSGDEERKIFAKRVAPFFNPHLDFRPYDRRDLPVDLVRG